MAGIDYRAAGDVVEHQSFLNGTRYFLLEGAIDLDGEALVWSVAVTLPKDAATEITEGDLTIGMESPAAWCGAVAGGAFRERVDEDTEVDSIDLDLRFRRLPDAESSLTWSAVGARITVESDVCTLELNVSP